MEGGTSSSSSSSGKNPTKSVEKLKISGVYSGVLEVNLDDWTLMMLREEIGYRLNFQLEPLLLKFFWCGKVLDPDDEENETLRQLGLKNNAKIHVTKMSTYEDIFEILAAEKQSQRLDRLEVAATATAKGLADGSLPEEEETKIHQIGLKLNLGSEANQQAVKTALLFHANARRLIRHELYNEALVLLTKAEEAFSLCDPKVIVRIHNLTKLQIDIVWCYFMLRDITWIKTLGTRLTTARKRLDHTRIKRSHYPDVALRLRLEVLEGVLAYHSGEFEKCKKALDSAQARYIQLQLSPEAVSQLISMGFSECEAKRGLRINDQDVQRAVEFLVQDKQMRGCNNEEQIQRRNEIEEQKRYGTTPQKKAVDLQRLNALVSTGGFERELAAEALRINENDTQKALDDLRNSDKLPNIQRDIDERKRDGQRQEAKAAIEELISMGFERSVARDPYSDYDTDVTNEGEAISEYLALLASADQSN